MKAKAAVDRSVTIRTATPIDLETIVVFNQAMALETERKTLDSATIKAGVRSALQDPDRALYFVAEADGKVVGQTMVTIEWSDWRNAYFWWIQSVYVTPPYRRRGVFRAIYQHIQKTARRRQDVCGLRLYVDQHNARAIDAYKQLGMIVSHYMLCEEDWSTGASAPTSDE